MTSQSSNGEGPSLNKALSGIAERHKGRCLTEDADRYAHRKRRVAKRRRRRAIDLANGDLRKLNGRHDRIWCRLYGHRITAFSICPDGSHVEWYFYLPPS